MHGFVFCLFCVAGFFSFDWERYAATKRGIQQLLLEDMCYYRPDYKPKALELISQLQKQNQQQGRKDSVSSSAASAAVAVTAAAIPAVAGASNASAAQQIKV